MPTVINDRHLTLTNLVEHWLNSARFNKFPKFYGVMKLENSRHTIVDISKSGFLEIGLICLDSVVIAHRHGQREITFEAADPEFFPKLEKYLTWRRNYFEQRTPHVSS